VSWVLRQPQVASALIGASSVTQLEQNIAALGAAPLTKEEITGIEPYAVHGTGL
jgi:L-glyceraldehyde 3-phosphate reductase